MRLVPLILSISLLLSAGCSDTPTSPVPQLNPLPGARLTAAFGVRSHDPVTGKRLVDGHHDGYDLAAPWGTPIHAAKAGRVVFAGIKGGYGNAVILTHAGGWSTLYGHASKLLVKPNQTVKVGQVIAYVGSTGHSTGPHLHYELRRYGVAVDPAVSWVSSAHALHLKRRKPLRVAHKRIRSVRLALKR